MSSPSSSFNAVYQRNRIIFGVDVDADLLAATERISSWEHGYKSASPRPKREPLASITEQEKKWDDKYNVARNAFISTLPLEQRHALELEKLRVELKSYRADVERLSGEIIFMREENTRLRGGAPG